MLQITQIISLLIFLYTLIHLSFYKLLELNTSEYVIEKKLNTTFDFIIVGGGSSGSVLANRLSENPNVRVLLIEAGGAETLNTEIPAMCISALQLTDLDWQYKSEPQSGACLAMNNQQSNWPRGKVLGGTGSINYNIYLRGQSQDYDYWQSLGNTGWNWTEVLKYFKKSEDNTDPTIAANSDFHGTGGPLTVSDVPFHTPLMTAFLQSADENDILTTELNGADSILGAGTLQGTLRNGTRCSPAKAFIKSVYTRTNLTIFLNSKVVKVLFDGKKATGVKFQTNGKEYTALAKKEVILSAGSVSSPQLLMLSGIGPQQDLVQLGINVVTNLQGVGKNLQDHYAAEGLVWTIQTNDSILASTLQSPTNLLSWFMNGTGPLTTLGAVEAAAFIKTSTANYSEPWPNCEIIFMAGSPVLDGGAFLRYMLNYNNETWNQYYAPILGNNTYSLIPMLLKPKSCGFIKLQSSNPEDKPIIQPNYFSDPADISDIVDCMKRALDLGFSDQFVQFGSEFIPTIQPGCESYPVLSDDYLQCLARHQTLTIYDPVGTNKMGPATDPLAVVDPEARVYNVTHLRVCDASIMPTLISGPTNAAAIMIAELISDKIKSTWNL